MSQYLTNLMVVNVLNDKYFISKDIIGDKKDFRKFQKFI